MSLFPVLSVLFVNLMPLYILIGLGFIAGKYLDVNLKSIARILLFFLLPTVMFGAIARMELNASYILLPVVMYGISTIITLSAYKLGGKIWKDGNANLIGAGSVNGNAIYFGLPVILKFFGPVAAGIYLFMNMGPQANNITLAYFLVARGKHNVRESFKKLLEFPVFHAAWVAVLWNVADVPLPEVFDEYWNYAAGAIVILGMMMIGIGLGKLETLAIDWGLMAALFLSKFVAWPVACFALVMLDWHIFQMFDPQIYQILLIFSAMPHIGNLVAYAAESDLHPERAASVVLFSSLFSIVSIPVAFWVLSLMGIPVGL